MVSAMGIGLWAIGGPWNMNSDPAGWGVVDDNGQSARSRGNGARYQLLDTAANYGAGHSERVLARAIEEQAR
jgi:aryl-alcohol dehydrogenase-like predicted oxidoreductase